MLCPLSALLFLYKYPLSPSPSRARTRRLGLSSVRPLRISLHPSPLRLPLLHLRESDTAAAGAVVPLGVFFRAQGGVRVRWGGGGGGADVGLIGTGNKEEQFEWPVS